MIESDDGLRERELRKLAVMSDAIADGFRRRGIDELTAVLAARIAVTAFNVAVQRWLSQDGERPLTDLVQDTLETLRSVAAEPLEAV